MSQSLFYSLATIGLLIVAFGPVAPSGVLWVAEHSVTSSVFYVVATVRVEVAPRIRTVR
jgi:hypothetical protein